jgi:hypothetical protein
MLKRAPERTGMKIQALEYDPEADELDLLLDSDATQPAESILVEAGVYSCREVGTSTRKIPKALVETLLAQTS